MGMTTLRQLGIGPAGEGWEPVNPSDANTGATYLQQTVSTEGLRTVVLDDWLKREQVGVVDFVKIDTEGMEVLVLSTATWVLETMSPLLYIEVAGEQLARFGSTLEELQAILDRHDYRLFRNVGRRQSRSATYELDAIENVFQDTFFDLLAIPPQRFDRLERLGLSAAS